MKKKIYLFVLLYTIVNCVRAQSTVYCTDDNRFTEKYVFKNNQIKKDTGITYARALNIDSVMQVLKFNIQYPKASADTFSKRPFILLLFGGGFTDGNRQMMDNYCHEFARRGFVAATIDYRLGKETVLPCADTLSQEKAVYRALQDARAAIRYFVHNASVYNIDTAWLFAGGFSAGAGTANAMVYNSQAELNSVYPSIVAELGKIDTSGNAYRNKFKIKGIFNNWGGVSSDFFDVDEGVPMVAFHGGLDGVVPIDSAIDVTCVTTSHYIYGSHALYSKLTGAHICCDLTVKLGGHHGVYNNSGSQLAFRVGRASCFFRSLFCDNCHKFITTDSIAATCSKNTIEIDTLGGDERMVITNELSDYTDVHINNLLGIFPNPADQSFTISLPGQTFAFCISDPSGRKVYESQNNTGKSEINCSRFLKGIYFIHIVTDKQAIYNAKIVIAD